MTQLNAQKLLTILLDLLAKPIAKAGKCNADLDDEFNLVKSGLIDSLEFINLIVELENRTGIEIDFSDIDPEEFTTIGGFIKNTLICCPQSNVKTGSP